MEWQEPNVCVDEHLSVDDAGRLGLQPWSVPRLVVDVRADSGADGKLTAIQALPGRLLIEAPPIGWTNRTPVDHMLLIRVTRAWRSWLTSQPNVVQMRDRWTYAMDRTPEVPSVTGIYASQVGGGFDLGTNSVAEPLPGRQWVWMPAHCVDEWVGPVAPGRRLNLRYRAYVWTPPPWSDNANKNAPQHEARAGYTRIQLLAFPKPGKLVADR